MILVDVNQLAIATIMVDLRLSHESVPNIRTTKERVLRSIGRYKCEWKHRFGETVICTDDKNYWRRSVFPYYKASRKVSRASSKHDWNTIFFQIQQIIEDLKTTFPMKVLSVPNAEADDIIGSICMSYGYYGPPQADREDILIVSGDKDLAQLLKFTNVHVYHPVQKRFVANMNPARALFEHVLRGDRGDGIPNFLSDSDTFVTGKRQKPIFETAVAEWLNKRPEEFCTESQLVNFKRNQQLIDLDQIPVELQQQCVRALRETQPSDGSNLMRYFVTNGLSGIVGDIQQFA